MGQIFLPYIVSDYLKQYRCCMQITEQQLQRFIDIYKKEFNICLSPIEAQQAALSLLRFMALSIIPFKKIEDYDIVAVSDLSK